jgi:hypothetical protein
MNPSTDPHLQQRYADFVAGAPGFCGHLGTVWFFYTKSLGTGGMQGCIFLKLMCNNTMEIYCGHL